MKRRRVVESASLLGLSAIAGCSGILGSSRGGLQELTLSGDVLHQPSSDHPGRVEATLSVTGNGPVTVLMGPALLLTAVDGAESSVFLQPQSDVGDVPAGRLTDGGCWKIADGERLEYRSSIESYVVRPDSPVTETYDVYTRGSQTQCLPTGAHWFEDTVSGESESSEALLEFVVELTDDHRVTIDEGATGITVR